MPDFNIETAIDAGKKIAAGNIIKINGHSTMLVPEGMTLQQFPELKEELERTQATVTTDDAESFIEYFNRYASDSSSIFLSAEKFNGIIDYHSEIAPAWCQHKVMFKPVTTTEWNKWSGANGHKFDQEEFAYFIEDCAEEIHNPPGAEMLEIATTLKAKSKVNFSSAKSLANGQTQLTYNEEIDGSAGAKGELKIPEIIDIGMRLYKGGDAYAMKARFRYRIREGKIAFWYDLIRPSKTVDAAIDDITVNIKSKVKCQMFIKGSV